VHGGEASWGIQRLAQRLPALTHVSFHYAWSAGYELVLDTLPNPHLLEQLIFDTGISGLDVVLPWLLPSFTALQSLDIGNTAIHDISPGFLLSLAQSSITHLTLSGTDFTADHLLSLLSGPCQMQKLKTLTLDGPWEQGDDDGDKAGYDRWEPSRGLGAEFCYERHWGVDRLKQTWRLTFWGSEMEGRAEEVVEAGRKNGIRVDGMILQGIEAEKEYQQEKEKLEKLIEERDVRYAALDQAARAAEK
jgi:hypothetical protein